MTRELGARLCAPRIVFGLFVVAIGVLFTLDNLGLVEASTYLRFWPVAFIAVGVASLTQARRSGGYVSGLVWITIGSWLLLDELDVIRVRFWDFWPLLLILLGGTIVWRALGPSASGSGDMADAASIVRGLAVMSGVKRTNASPSFRGGDLTAVMGGCEIDLRQATITGGPAVIDVLAFWGGIELRVPERWLIDSKITPFLGGVEDRTRPTGEASERLVIKGVVVMGGIEIKN
jgi:predicted membrane protein